MKLHLKNIVPGNDWQGALRFLDTLDWNLTWRNSDDQYLLYSGDKPLVSAATKEEIEAFVVGMALGLGVLPEKILDEIRELIAE